VQKIEKVQANWKTLLSPNFPEKKRKRRRPRITQKDTLGHSHHLSLRRPFTLDLKLICYTKLVLRSLPGSIWTAFIDLGSGPD